VITHNNNQSEVRSVKRPVYRSNGAEIAVYKSVLAQQIAGEHFFSTWIVQGEGGSVDRLSTSLFEAGHDLNPHQIEFELYSMRHPIQEGMQLADELGLRKTVEAASGSSTCPGAPRNKCWWRLKQRFLRRNKERESIWPTATR
jgi:hypothetical protein